MEEIDNGGEYGDFNLPNNSIFSGMRKDEIKPLFLIQ